MSEKRSTAAIARRNEKRKVRAAADRMRLKGTSTLRNGAGQLTSEWTKTERDSDDPPKHMPVPEGHFVSKVSTLLDGQGLVRAQWLQAPKAAQDIFAGFAKAAKQVSEEYRNTAQVALAPSSTENTLTVYPLGDPHIGMLAWREETGADFDLSIAQADLLSTVSLLVERTPPSEEAVIANLGDFFHAEDDRQTTPRGGNKLDCDSRASKITKVGLSLMRRLIDLLLVKHASVRVVNLRGNHDPYKSLLLEQYLLAVYESEPRVSVLPSSNPFVVLEWGKNLHMYVHTDGGKVESLPGVLASDAAEAWGRTEHRRIFGGHHHIWEVKEFPGVTFERFRTLAPRDYWAHHAGFRSKQSLSALTFDKVHGEISRVTVDLGLSRSL